MLCLCLLRLVTKYFIIVSGWLEYKGTEWESSAVVCRYLPYLRTCYLARCKGCFLVCLETPQSNKISVLPRQRPDRLKPHYHLFFRKIPSFVLLRRGKMYFCLLQFSWGKTRKDWVFSLLINLVPGGLSTITLLVAKSTQFVSRLLVVGDAGS